MKNEKKTIILAVVVLLLVVVGAVGASYAYFATVNKTTGNDKDLNIVTEDLGSIKWEGTKVFESEGLLPGEMGIQTFTIEKSNNSGKGMYEIDLKGILDESFGSDVEISLYKSTNPTTDIVTIAEGESTISGDDVKQYYKEDSVVLNGTPEKVYGVKALKNKDQIILEQADFDNSTLAKTTYYLVYHYKNNGDQNAQQGKSFSGEISVRLILDKITKLSEYVETFASDTAVDDYGNTRYIGADPNNYVSIDGEVYPSDVYYGYYDDTSNMYLEYSSLERCTNASSYNFNCTLVHPKGAPVWRIIGVMKNVDDGTGNKNDRVKIIRDPLTDGYIWDTSESSINNGRGVNEWSQSKLMKLLNPGYESEAIGGSLYWNNSSGKCHNGENNITKSCDFTSTGIKDKLKSLISDAVWNTGSSMTCSQIASKFYTEERGTRNGKICTSGDYCNDMVERTTTWTGKVGLMYPSDYGYATSGGSTTDRATCLNTALTWWQNSSECFKNDWIYTARLQWNLSPYANAYNADSIFITEINGNVSYYSSGIGSFQVRPTVYLLSNVKISGGTGTQTNPYILSEK